MARFFSGFLLASLLWGGFIFAYSRGLVDISLEPPAPPEADPSIAAGDEGGDADARRKRRTSSRKGKVGARGGNSTSGDDLGENEARAVDITGGGSEAQLRSTEIEQGFDAAFGQVRRCLILAASDEPARGKVTFGLRVTGDGRVTAVNLSGPSAVTQGECGSCLRKAAGGIRFRSYGGPDMVVHYPLTLE